MWLTYSMFIRTEPLRILKTIAAEVKTESQLCHYCHTLSYVMIYNKSQLLPMNILKMRLSHLQPKNFFTILDFFFFKAENCICKFQNKAEGTGY